MEHLNYNSGIEHLFKYLKAEQFMVFGSLNKHSLEMVQRYFQSVEIPPMKIDNSTDHLLNYFYKIRLYTDEYIFRPVSIKCTRGIRMFGWIISGKEMLKTGDRFRPYPWWFCVGQPYHAGGGIPAHEVSEHSPIIKAIGCTKQLRLA
jgi:hypothetical protein